MSRRISNTNFIILHGMHIELQWPVACYCIELAENLCVVVVMDDKHLAPSYGRTVSFPLQKYCGFITAS